MKAPKDFFSALREKLNVTPRSSLDREFWAKFDGEFTPKRRVQPWLGWQVLLPLGAAALLRLVVWRSGFFPSGPKLDVAQVSAMEDMVEHSDLLHDLDFYLGGKDVSEWEAVSSLDDSEWRELIEG